MHRLSLVQALSLWSDLDDAYYGKSGFGGEVAEIYAYRLMLYAPMVAESLHASDGEAPKKGGLIDQGAREVIREANETFNNLLVHYAEERHAIVEIETRVNNAWEFVDASAYFKSCTETDCYQSHRFHVRVRPREDDRYQTRTIAITCASDSVAFLHDDGRRR